MNLLLALALSITAADTSAPWPGFLGAGPARTAVKGLPLTWSLTENIAWKAALPGHGQSSPVIAGDKVFVTSIEGPMKDKCLVTAVSLADGKQLWQHAIDSSDKVKDSLYVSRAAPTPVVDSKHVYAFFESGDVVALTHDGKAVWQRSLSVDYGKFKNKFGLAASPVIVGPALILLVDDEGPSYLVALSLQDGTTLWKTERTSRTSWSSPGVIEVDGKPTIVCSSAGSVDGYDPATGARLWTYQEIGGNTSATPLDFGAGRFLVGASAGREGEANAFAKKSNLAMTVELIDGKPTPKVLWRAEQAASTFASPMVYAGHAYWVNRAGVVYCYDIATGELKYTERVKQSSWATPLGVCDRVYFFGKDGITTVIRAGAKFEILAENQLWDPDAIKPDPAAAEKEDTAERRAAAANFSGPVQYGIAALDGTLLIRTGEVLYCVRGK